MNIDYKTAKTIREKFLGGHRAADLAADFTCSISTIYRILRNESHYDRNYRAAKKVKLGLHLQEMLDLKRGRLTNSEVAKTLADRHGLDKVPSEASIRYHVMAALAERYKNDKQKGSEYGTT